MVSRLTLCALLSIGLCRDGLPDHSSGDQNVHGIGRVSQHIGQDLDCVLAEQGCGATQSVRTVCSSARGRRAPHVLR